MATIGLFLPSSEDDYHRQIAQETAAYADRLGWTLETAYAEDTPAKQVLDVVRFANAQAGHRACALLVPLTEGAADRPFAEDPTYRLARQVLRRNLGWITINHGREDWLASLRSDFAGQMVSMVVIDNVEFGRIQARQLRALLPAGGEILLVLGNLDDTACRDRSLGLREALDGAPFRVSEIDGRWRPEVAEAAAMHWLQSRVRSGEEPDAVVAQDDEMGMAVRRSLERVAQETGRPHLAQIAILGGDGLESKGRRWVDEGLLKATVRVTLPGRPAVDSLARFWGAQRLPEAVTRLAPTSHPPLGTLTPVARS